MVYNDYTKTSDQPDILDYYKQYGFPNLGNGGGLIAKNAYRADMNTWGHKYNVPQSLIDSFTDPKMIDAPDTDKKNFWQKAAAAITNVKDKVVDITTHNPVTGALHSIAKGDKIKKLLQNGKEAALVTLFVPFKPLAILFLKSRGIEPADDTKTLLRQVVTEKNKANFGAADSAAPGNGSSSVPITPDMVVSMINFLKSIFDSIQKKKAEGKPLTPDEQKIADAAPLITESFNTAKDEAAAIETQSENDAVALASESESGINIFGINISKTVLIVLLLLLALFFFLKFK